MADIIEGRNPVLEALRSGRVISKIWLAKNAERHGVIGEILFLARTNGVPVEYVDRPAIDRQTAGMVNQGILAFTSAKAYLSLDEILAASAAKKEHPFFIVLDGIEDPYNLGAIIRTVDASGAHGVIVRERRAVGLTSIVEKASAGALEYVPVARVVNIAQTLETLKQQNIWVVGVDRQGDSEYTRTDYKPPTAIVIGGEGQGLSELVKKRCDFLVHIPMLGRISSLNASVAAAVVMYEVARQRAAKG
ncbi:MAG TPA: 23S rRNA (guanosine(2251)-2'-O)-methyltransferase RlmB [Dehalococcoidales bacterium]